MIIVTNEFGQAYWMLVNNKISKVVLVGTTLLTGVAKHHKIDGLQLTVVTQEHYNRMCAGDEVFDAIVHTTEDKLFYSKQDLINELSNDSTDD